MAKPLIKTEESTINPAGVDPAMESKFATLKRQARKVIKVL